MGRMDILIALLVLGGLGYGTSRFVRQRRAATQSTQATQTPQEVLSSPEALTRRRLAEPEPRPAGPGSRSAWPASPPG
jgi:hypothetical protein